MAVWKSLHDEDNDGRRMWCLIDSTDLYILETEPGRFALVRREDARQPNPVWEPSYHEVEVVVAEGFTALHEARTAYLDTRRADRAAITHGDHDHA